MAEPEKAGDIADAKLDSLKNNQESDDKPKHGGKREGAGRKDGSKNIKTREREAILEGFRLRVGLHADRLFNAQANLATGEQYLYCKTTTTGKDGKRTSTTEVVTDPEIIKQYLDDSLDQGDDEYYYISTKPANNMAIDSLLNRAFGTPQKNIDVKSDGQGILSRMEDEDVKRIASAMGAALSGTDDEPTE